MLITRKDVIGCSMAMGSSVATATPATRPEAHTAAFTEEGQDTLAYLAASWSHMI